MAKAKAASKRPSARQQAQNYVVDGSQYALGKIIGSGSFATVHLAVHIPSGSQVAIKRLDRARPDQEKQVECEIEILKKAGSHPNIVAFHGWFRDDSNILCLVLGYCEGGSLDSLTKQKGSTESYFSEAQIMEWFAQMLAALGHLHQHHIIHRDIKPQNVFVSKNLKIIRLGDLGIAKQLDGTQDLATTQLGTPYYMSPEVVANRPYTYASDIWALGCVLYECAARRAAFEAQSLPQLWLKILRTAYQPLPSHFSPPFRQLVGLMLRADPEDRQPASRLMMLPIVRATYENMVSRAPVASKVERPFTPVTTDKIITDTPASGLAAAACGSSEATAQAQPAQKDAARCKASKSKTLPAAPHTRKRDPRKSQTSNPRGSQSGVLGRHRRGGQATLKRPNTAAAPVRAMARTAKVRQWDDALNWEIKQAERAERRFRAFEHEKHMTRVAAKQWRKENDPVEQVKIAERAAIEKAIKEDADRAAGRLRAAKRTQEEPRASDVDARDQSIGAGSRSDDPLAFSWNFTPAAQPALPLDLREIPRGMMLATCNDFGSKSPHGGSTVSEPPGNEILSQAAPPTINSRCEVIDGLQAIETGQSVGGDEAPVASGVTGGESNSAKLKMLCVRLEALMQASDVPGMQQLLEQIWKQTLADNAGGAGEAFREAAPPEDGLLTPDQLRLLRANPSLFYGKSLSKARPLTGSSSLAATMPAPYRSSAAADPVTVDGMAFDMDLPRGIFAKPSRKPPPAVATSLPFLPDARAVSLLGDACAGELRDDEIVSFQPIDQGVGRVVTACAEGATTERFDSGLGATSAAVTGSQAEWRRGDAIALATSSQALLEAARSSVHANSVGGRASNPMTKRADEAGGISAAGSAFAAWSQPPLLDTAATTVADTDNLEEKELEQMYRTMAQQVEEIQAWKSKIGKKLERLRAGNGQASGPLISIATAKEEDGNDGPLSGPGSTEDGEEEDEQDSGDEDEDSDDEDDDEEEGSSCDDDEDSEEEGVSEEEESSDDDSSEDASEQSSSGSESDDGTGRTRDDCKA